MVWLAPWVRHMVKNKSAFARHDIPHILVYSQLNDSFLHPKKNSLLHLLRKPLKFVFRRMFQRLFGLTDSHFQIQPSCLHAANAVQCTMSSAECPCWNRGMPSTAPTPSGAATTFTRTVLNKGRVHIPRRVRTTESESSFQMPVWQSLALVLLCLTQEDVPFLYPLQDFLACLFLLS